MMVLSFVVCFSLIFTAVCGGSLKRDLPPAPLPPPNCPTIMCRDPCPRGQYLALSEFGCETCDCYDPCENFPCEIGECHWMLDEKTRPLPFCVACSGGQQWSECTGGSDCVATCANIAPVCDRHCFPGCRCPHNKPILHHGECIAADECQDLCEGGQEWTECGVESAPTCRNLFPESHGSACVSRCQCPSDRPIWDSDRSLCVTQNQCMQYYYREKSKSDAAKRDAKIADIFNWQ